MLNNTNTETYKQANAQVETQYAQKQTSLLRQQTQNLQTSKHTAEDTIRNNKHHTFTSTNTELTRYRS